ncbi:hypothetical protein VKT23_012729 [Stygiomarasmius scandens]|uniref:Hydrophobin n=1 Tax=Marasmiellus scandens TaxID=2682957 RepID=A0ABR1J509_9AGAR
MYLAIFSALLPLSLALMSSAQGTSTSTPPPAIPASQCTTPPTQCCTTFRRAADQLPILVGIVHVPIEDLVGDIWVGISCAPITSTNTCSTNALCCKNNQFGTVALDCVPVELGQ